MHEIESALRVYPDYAQALTMRAFIRLAQGYPGEAAEDARRALSLDPNDAASLLALATSFNSLGSFDEAEQAAEQSLALRADSWQARLELAKSFYGHGNYVVALRELDVARIDFADAHLVRGNVLLNLGRSKEAADEFRIFLREAGSDPRWKQVESIVTALSGVSTQLGALTD
jgi:protein O-mannosyl-transferase